MIRDWGELLRILNSSENSDVTIYVDYSGDLKQIGMTEENGERTNEISDRLASPANATQGKIAALL